MGEYKNYCLLIRKEKSSLVYLPLIYTSKKWQNFSTQKTGKLRKHPRKKSILSFSYIFSL